PSTPTASCVVGTVLGPGSRSGVHQIGVARDALRRERLTATFRALDVPGLDVVERDDDDTRGLVRVSAERVRDLGGRLADLPAVARAARRYRQAPMGLRAKPGPPERPRAGTRSRARACRPVGASARGPAGR